MVVSGSSYFTHMALIKVESMHQHLEETFHTSQKDAPILSGMSGNFQFCACALMDLKCPSTVKGPALSTLLLFTMSDSSKDLKRSLGFCTEDGSFDLDSKIANDKVFKDMYDLAPLLKSSRRDR